MANSKRERCVSPSLAMLEEEEPEPPLSPSLTMLFESECEAVCMLCDASDALSEASDERAVDVALQEAPARIEDAQRKKHYRRNGYSGSWTLVMNRGKLRWAKVKKSNCSVKSSKFTCGECGQILHTLSSASRHAKETHGILEKSKFVCDHKGCGKIFLQPGRLALHKKAHEKDRSIQCRFPGCGKGFWKHSTRNQHEARHENKKYKCTHAGCSASFHDRTGLRRHARVHCFITDRYKCTECDVVFSSEGGYGSHMRLKHRDAATVLKCEHCPYTTKHRGCMKQHMLLSHDVGIIWKVCDVDGCRYQCKQKGRLMDHIKRMHNEEFVKRKKQQEERVRVALVAAGYREWFATANVPPVGFFKREKRIDFRCAGVQSATAHCRIDFVLSLRGGLVFLEVDENQHQYGYEASISCDMKRMSHVMESLFVELGEALPNVYWLRYNPNACRVDGDLVRVPKEERERRLVRWLEAFEATAPLQIGYAFYDSEDGELEVLSNEEYSPHLAEVAEDLGQLEARDAAGDVL